MGAIPINWPAERTARPQTPAKPRAARDRVHITRESLVAALARRIERGTAKLDGYPAANLEEARAWLVERDRRIWLVKHYGPADWLRAPEDHSFAREKIAA